jgi:hypothetical protein
MGSWVTGICYDRPQALVRHVPMAGESVLGYIKHLSRVSACTMAWKLACAVSGAACHRRRDNPGYPLDSSGATLLMHAPSAWGSVLGYFKDISRVSASTVAWRLACAVSGAACHRRRDNTGYPLDCSHATLLSRDLMVVLEYWGHKKHAYKFSGQSEFWCFLKNAKLLCQSGVIRLALAII